MLRKHLYKIQTILTVTLIVLFVMLVSIQVSSPQANTETAFSVVAGWLGIVIGFFFNQELVKSLQEKLLRSERLREQTSRQLETTTETVKKRLEELKAEKQLYEKIFVELTEEKL